ncbi:hypothetical protein K450DRAFT_278077 [Umbelopsis ramanniana AG]|uniref:PRELI/MSF1 domain-containing protein n=1 Tax=Umbelopsis ramanniana AG TaxID=1314678 RepID=A0AAD5HH34_UMBRA|nr:uncharacterized protein K450DRAFT_278077 [Umbelopsis ramanniana AG]KAI8582779.1 hypothetical protein K450DRAFT_278077 [Umbelopsis ramanniana AG]
MTVTPSTRYIYPYAWDLAVVANQARYPTHPSVPVLLGADIVTDELYLTAQELEHTGLSHPSIRPITSQEAARIQGDFVMPSNVIGLDLIPQIGVRRIVRNCRIKVDFPALLKKAVNVSELIVKHETVIDSRLKTLTVTGSNETLTGLVSLGDVTVYRTIQPNENIEDATLLGVQTSQSGGCLFEQHAFLDIRVKIPFKTSIESHILKTYRKTTGEGRVLDLQLMEAIKKEQQQDQKTIVEERVPVLGKEKASQSPHYCGELPTI